MVFVFWIEIAYSRTFWSGFWGIWPTKWGAWLTGPQKGKSLCGTTPFDVLSVKIGATVLALACRKNPQTKKKRKKRNRVKTISPIQGSKMTKRIVTKFCVVVGLPDRVIHAKLSDDRFSHFCMVSGRISGFPIDFGCRPYNTPALLCRSVMMSPYPFCTASLVAKKVECKMFVEFLFCFTVHNKIIKQLRLLKQLSVDFFRTGNTAFT